MWSFHYLLGDLPLGQILLLLQKVDKSPDSRVGASHQASETVVPTLGNVGTSRESGHDSIMKSNKWNRDMFRFLLYFIPDVLDFPSG